MFSNYFTVFAAADKEMMHSAMLRYILCAHGTLARRLFTRFRYPVVRATLEKTYIEKKRRFRMDVVAWSKGDEHMLVIENKFKSFPTLSQLQDYDNLYWERKEEPTCYLVCFDKNGVAFQGNGDIHTNHSIWHILTYREIQIEIEKYLDEQKMLEAEQRSFLCHYARYLRTYYTRYDAVLNNYTDAFVIDNEEEISEDDKREAVQENRFWQRLALSFIANGFAAERRKQGVEANECDTEYGGSTVPLITIYPEHWNKHVGNTRPLLCVQMQGDCLKLGIVRQRKNSTDAFTQKLRTCILELGTTQTLSLEIIPDDVVGRRLEHKNRFITLCRRRFKKDMPVKQVGEQLWNFFQELDEPLMRAGLFEE